MATDEIPTHEIIPIGCVEVLAPGLTAAAAPERGGVAGAALAHFFISAWEGSCRAVAGLVRGQNGGHPDLDGHRDRNRFRDYNRLNYDRRNDSQRGDRRGLYRCVEI